MKLLRLKITDQNGFRSLQTGFEIFFRNERNQSDVNEFNPFVLAGPNGSGKSNLLEILASIFFHLECMYLNYRPESFEYNEETNPQGFQGTFSSPDAFELEYLIKDPVARYWRDWTAPQKEKAQNTHVHIKIIKEVGSSPIFIWVNRSIFEKADDNKILEKEEIKQYLPQYILGYSSGENEIVSLPFYKMRFIHFDEYRNILIRDDFYGQVPEGRLVYLDEHLNQSILLANFLMQDKTDLTIFEEELQLSDIKQFQIIIGKNHFEKKHDDLLKNLSHEDLSNELKTKIELTNKLTETIDKFKSCSTTFYESYDEESEYQCLMLDYYVTDETKKAFRFHFEDDPLKLFQALQILYTLNYAMISTKNREKIYSTQNIYLKQDLTSISLDEDSIFRIKDLKLQKGNLAEDIFTRSLSDGEYQLLHSIGLCLLYRNSNSLFLLDEPETHFNPDWRAKFITILKKVFEESDSTQDLLITTHTPYLISDSKRENVLVFEKKNNKCTVIRPDYNTFGASINKITMMTFNKTVTMGGLAESVLNKISSRAEKGESLEKLIEELNSALGDSVEKVLLMKSLSEEGESE